MSYDTDLEKRIDQVIQRWGVELGKKKMFGGLGYFINGNMCFAIRGDQVLLRLEEAQAAKLVERPGVYEAVMGSRPMKNWLEAGGEAIDTPDKLLEILAIGRDYALQLPAK